MDPTQFDTLTKRIVAAPSRRALLGGALGILAGLLDAGEGVGKRKRHRGKHEHQRDQKRKQRPTKAAAKQCRREGHPCTGKGNATCCAALVCEASGPGKARRCTQCPTPRRCDGTCCGADEVCCLGPEQSEGGRRSCVPAGNQCCPATDGGGSCGSDETCCAPGSIAPIGSCAPGDGACCANGNGGWSSPAFPICCPAGSADFSCEAGQRCCPFGSRPLRDHPTKPLCCPEETTCCPRACCHEGTHCCSDTAAAGCCEEGTVCCAAVVPGPALNGRLNSAQQMCCPADTPVCCGSGYPEPCCPAAHVCDPDAGCVPGEPPPPPTPPPPAPPGQCYAVGEPCDWRRPSDCCSSSCRPPDFAGRASVAPGMEAALAELTGAVCTEAAFGCTVESEGTLCSAGGCFVTVEGRPFCGGSTFGCFHCDSDDDCVAQAGPGTHCVDAPVPCAEDGRTRGRACVGEGPAAQ